MIHGVTLTKQQDQLFKKIAPKWYSHVKLSDDPDLVMDHFEYSLSVPYACLVGECYNHTHVYCTMFKNPKTKRFRKGKEYCDKCACFADMFLDSWEKYDFNSISLQATETADTWADILPKFLDHFARKHKERIPK